MGVIEWVDSAFQDARYGLRGLGKAPGLVAAVVVSLTIGVGANTAIFSLVDAAILRPLPVKDPGTLRILEWTNKGFPEGVHNVNGEVRPVAGGRIRGSSVGASVYRRLVREQTAFEALIGIADFQPVAIGVDGLAAEQVGLQYVSANFFQGLGVTPVVGRGFGEEEDRVGHEPVVIVSERLWERRLGGRTDALERGIRINNVAARIVGVAPRGFFGMRAGEWTDVYAPLAMRAAFQPSGSDGTARGEDDHDWWVRQVVRLKAGVGEGPAMAQLGVLFGRLAVPEGKGEEGRIPELTASPGARGFQALNAGETRALWIMMLLVGVVMLLVCANVANLLLSRAVGRQRESAVRLALGAPRGRLVRQALIESGLLAVMGGVSGLVLGYGLARSIPWVFETGEFDLGIDPRVLGYTGGVAMLTCFLFGLAPALQAAGADAGEALKRQGRSIMSGRLRLPRLLVAIQIALCLTALVAAGLLGRSLRKLNLVDVGFERENLAYASVNPWQAGYSEERVGAYADRVCEALAGVPGVVRVSLIRVRPLQGGGTSTVANFAGSSDAPERRRVNVNRVGKGLFETLGLGIVAGRTFEEREFRRDAEAVVVDELFARRFFPGENAVGRRFGYGKENQRYEIVGVVRGSRYNSLQADAVPIVYHPYLPGEMKGSPIHVAIRSRVDSRRLAEGVRRAIALVDPAVPMSQFHTQNGLIDRMLRTERLLGFVSAAFGVVALLLAGIGLAGVLGYAVARRTSEIGLRMALGAAAGDVVAGVVRDSLGMAGAGIVVGVPCAYGVARMIRSALFGAEAADPWTGVAALGAMVGVGLVAAWIPARRAARIDPVVALREE